MLCWRPNKITNKTNRHLLNVQNISCVGGVATPDRKEVSGAVLWEVIVIGPGYLPFVGVKGKSLKFSLRFRIRKAYHSICYWSTPWKSCCEDEVTAKYHLSNLRILYKLPFVCKVPLQEGLFMLTFKNCINHWRLSLPLLGFD